MYKLTIIVAIAIVSMAFVQSGISKKVATDGNNTLSMLSPDQGGKGNKGGGGGQGGHSKNNGGGSHAPQGGHAKKGGRNQGGHTIPMKHKSQGSQGKGSMKQNQKNHAPKNNQFKDHGKRGNSHKGNHAMKGNKGPKGHFSKGHPNHGYVYINNHGYISHSNYGQWRSQQAKNKHKKYHPVYEYEAVEGFNFIISRNVFLFSETAYKINLYTVRLAEKRKAGTITVVEYDNSIQRIAVLERRRAELQVNISL